MMRVIIMKLQVAILKSRNGNVIRDLSGLKTNYCDCAVISLVKARFGLLRGLDFGR